MAEDRANDPNRRPDVTPVSAPGQSKAGSLHKGKSGYYEEHHSSSRYVGGCKSCMNEQKSGKHPLA
jgi:hypothetical protein